jgi:Asp/Glu/hydantoin racemase
VKILLASANATHTMTDARGTLARDAASARTEVVAWTKSRAADRRRLLRGRCGRTRAVATVRPVVEQLAAETGADLVILGGSRLSRYAVRIRGLAPLPAPVACGMQLGTVAVRPGRCKGAIPAGLWESGHR